MKILTALGNEIINKKIKENLNEEIFETDIQYQEALLEVIEENKNINLLILSSILPGELNIYELINIIKYKNPYLEIIIILEKEDNKLEEFLISKNINDIYYNNKITIGEILQKINNKKNKSEKIILENNLKKENNINKKIINLINKIKNKINKKNNIKYLKKNKKIISIIGAKKIGKTIFSIILSLNIKNKKILLINMDFLKNDIKTIIGKKNDKKMSMEISMEKWKNNLQIMQIGKYEFEDKKLNNKQKAKEFLDEISKDYDYVIIDIGDINGKENIIKNCDENIVLVEGNLLGLKEIKDILSDLINQQKNRTESIKIVFNKQTKFSVSRPILHTMFSDFKIIGELKYDDIYNMLINTNMKIGSCKIDKEYKKIVSKII